jgi:hypothetical protein
VYTFFLATLYLCNLYRNSFSVLFLLDGVYKRALARSALNSSTLGNARFNCG